MTNYINYVTLAGPMVDYLMAIAGASLTVLTLVMAFDKKPENATIQPVLICSLIVAVVASFIGIHEFSMISSLELGEEMMNKASLGHKNYIVAYPNIAIAANFFLMAMLLLTPAFDPESARFLWNLLVLTFSSLILVQVLWTLETVFLLAPNFKAASLIASIFVVMGLTTFKLLLNDTRRRLASRQPQSMAFMICVMVSMSTIGYDIIFPHDFGPLEFKDVCYYALALSLIYSSISCLGWLGLTDVHQEMQVKLLDSHGHIMESPLQ